MSAVSTPSYVLNLNLKVESQTAVKDRSSMKKTEKNRPRKIWDDVVGEC